MASGVECHSADEPIGAFSHLWECANACQEISECNFFKYGTGYKEGQCWWEKTENRDCPEGWDPDYHNFYEIISK